MDFHVTAQRGDLTSVTCSGLPELETALDNMKMSIRDVTCRTTESIVTLLGAMDGPVCVGWATRRGWIYVEEKTR